MVQTVDLEYAESELPENLFVVFANFWSALCGYFGDAVYLKRTAYGGCQLAAGTFEHVDALGDLRGLDRDLVEVLPLRVRCAAARQHDPEPNE